MKRFLCALITILCCLSFALAENGEGLFNIAGLDEDETLFAFLDDNHIDTIYRPEGQPYAGTASEGTVVAFVEYMELANPGLVMLRLYMGITTYEELYGTALTLSAGDTEQTFAVDPMVSEYDMICQEDYTVWLTAETEPLVKAVIAAGGVLSFTIHGDREITGTLQLDAEALRTVWDNYAALGGFEQDFSRLK